MRRRCVKAASSALSMVCDVISLYFGVVEDCDVLRYGVVGTDDHQVDALGR
jgi:hypothetical protein